MLENVSVPENRDKTIEHPIYAPFIVHEYYGFEIGDELTVTYHQQTYGLVCGSRRGNIRKLNLTWKRRENTKSRENERGWGADFKTWSDKE